MALPSETTPLILDAIEVLDVYRAQQEERLASLSDTLRRVEPVLNNTDTINAALAVKQRPDLVLTQRARMRAIPSLELARIKFQSFGPSFAFYTASVAVGEHDVTRTELDAMANGSYQRTGDNTVPNHSRKAAFVRSLVLAPDLMTQLVLDISRPRGRGRTKELVPELFTAYQIMSQLVDAHDLNVMREPGVVDDGYLLH